MSRDSAKPVSAALVSWQNGDQEALHALMPRVYDELRPVAHQHLQAGRKDHTLRSTELVHEAYLRLVDQQSSEVENRAHFFAVAARLMREILGDDGRSRRALKRGYGCKVTLDQAADMCKSEISMCLLSMTC